MPKLDGMTPDEFRTSRERLGLTRDALASVLGVHPRTVARWENNESAIPGPALAVLTMMLQATPPAPDQNRSRPGPQPT